VPKITSDAVRPVSLGLRQSDIDFINRTGTGNNMGARLRSLLLRCQDIFDDIKGKPGSFLVFQQTDMGKMWAIPDNLPFTINKKAGWREVPATAKAAGYISQVIENTETGVVEVWIAPGRAINDCVTCRQKMMAMIEEVCK
jgi:hypothetical protein